MITKLCSEHHRSLHLSTVGLDVVSAPGRAVYTRPHKPSSRCSKTQHTASLTLFPPNTTQCHTLQLNTRTHLWQKPQCVRRHETNQTDDSIPSVARPPMQVPSAPEVTRSFADTGRQDRRHAILPLLLAVP